MNCVRDLNGLGSNSDRLARFHLTFSIHASGETAAPSNPPYAEGNNGAVVRQSKSPSGKQSVSRTEMDTDEFEHIAALIAGELSHEYEW